MHLYNFYCSLYRVKNIGGSRLWRNFSICTIESKSLVANLAGVQFYSKAWMIWINEQHCHCLSGHIFTLQYDTAVAKQQNIVVYEKFKGYVGNELRLVTANFN